MKTKTLARLTGLGYLLIFFTGFFSNFYVLESLIAIDPVETTTNLIGEHRLFRQAILGFSVMILIDILLAGPLYALLRDVNGDIALFSSALRLINGGVFAAALHSLFSIQHLTDGSQTATANMASEVARTFETFNFMWSFALLFFGLHLILLGYLIARSIRFPRFIGILLVVAGVGYLVDGFAQIGLENYKEYSALFENIVVIPAVIGELSLTVFLLVKGVFSDRS